MRGKKTYVPFRVSLLLLLKFVTKLYNHKHNISKLVIKFVTKMSILVLETKGQKMKKNIIHQHSRVFVFYSNQNRTKSI